MTKKPINIFRKKRNNFIAKRKTPGSSQSPNHRSDRRQTQQQTLTLS